MTSPSVSVVIPCFRQAHFLRESLESVLAQTHRAHQVVVVDDGSPDAVDVVAQVYPDVVYVRQENQGLAAARNRGLEECTGEFIVFLDADDRLLPNALAEGGRALAGRSRCAFVWGFNRPIGSDGELLPAEPRIWSGGATYRQLLEENVVGPPLAVMFRRAVVAAAGGFSRRVKFAEDYELYLRLAREHESYCHQQMIAEYRIHDANMSADLSGMLQGVLGTLNEQKPWVKHDRELRKALRTGRRKARESYDGTRRLGDLSRHARGGRYVRASVCAATLLALYPRMFLPILVSRMKRSVGSLTA